MIRLILSIVFSILGVGVLATIDRPYFGVGLLMFGLAFYGWHLSTLASQEEQEEYQYRREYF